MTDRVENFAQFLYRRRFGLTENDPLPSPDDSVWRAFRQQAKDIIFFTDAQEAATDEATRWKERFLAAVEDAQELRGELFKARQEIYRLKEEKNDTL